MAYVTGTANSLTDLLSAIQNACTANGWTLSGSVLHKGTCFVEVKINSTVITIQAGTGIDGSNNLVGRADTAQGMIGFGSSAGGYWCGASAFAFPVAYYASIQTSPDEVYITINYGVSFYQTFGFGVSQMPGLPGTGNWYYGPNSNRPIGQSMNSYLITTNGEEGRSGQGSLALFMGGGFGIASGGVDHKLDSATWAARRAWQDWASLFYRQPNQWNQESVLIPVRAYADRPSGFVSPVLECAHARFVSIANLADEQIITLGSDRWKVYPVWSRGSAVYSDTVGHAIRYDGP